MGKRRRGAVLGAGIAALVMFTGACADTGGDEPGGENAPKPSAADIDCAQFEQFGDLSGEVEVYTGIVAPEDTPFIDTFAAFTDCTGVDVNYNGSKQFEAQLPVRVQSGNAPDLAFLPQPGLLAQMVSTGKVVAAPQAVVDQVDENWTEAWKGYGTVDGTFYAAPLGANYKSLVWYSPGAFADAGYEVPTTWEEMIALSDQISADGVQPWCAGIGSDAATGWPLTDWLEEAVLRTAGPEVYDQWINHEIAFDDPAVLEALGMVGDVLKNPDYVNGGYGDVRSIASTSFQDGGLPILDGTCFMHKQASFYQANWPEGTDVSEDGDVFAFPFPSISGDVGDVGIGGGEFVAAFNERPETAALQYWLATSEWANLKAQVSGPGWLSANTGLDTSNLTSPIDQLAAEQLTNEDLTFRFDASDLMPAEVGSSEEFKQLTEWIASDQDDQTTLTNIEAAWPPLGHFAGRRRVVDWFLEADSVGHKLLLMGFAVVLFVVVMGVILLAVDKAKRVPKAVLVLAFTGPALLAVGVGLVYPALKTVWASFRSGNGSEFVGLANYSAAVTNDDLQRVLLNTVAWVVLVPLVSTVFGLVYAYVVDRTRFESLAKALVFLPMAISGVAAGIIWKFVYEYRPDQGSIEQIGVLNQLLVWVGVEPQQFLLDRPGNTLALIAVMIWINAGFAMTVLSASIKNIDDAVVEAARLDGVNKLQLFRFITVPSIRPALVVVLTTVAISTLKAFDVVFTMTGGQFGTSVLANEFYSQSFRQFNQGLGAALAVMIFVLVIPIIIYNVRQMRLSEEVR
jgi:alpha-glucoside transport system substrate-binding protein